MSMSIPIKLLVKVDYDHPSPGLLQAIFKLIDEKTGLNYGMKVLNPLKYFGDYIRALQNRWRNKFVKYCMYVKGFGYVTTSQNIPKIEAIYQNHLKELQEFEKDLKEFLTTGKIEKLYYKRNPGKRAIWQSIDQVYAYINEARRILEEREGIKWEDFVAKVVQKEVTKRFKIYYLPLLSLPPELADKVIPDKNLQRIFENQIKTVLAELREAILTELRGLKSDMINALKSGNVSYVHALIQKMIRRIHDLGFEDYMRDTVEWLRENFLKVTDPSELTTKVEML